MTNYHLHIVVNQQAASGNAKKSWLTIKKELIKLNIPFDNYITEYAGHTLTYIENIAPVIISENEKQTERFHLIVVLGGDGTLHEAMNGLPDSLKNLPIGYIPCGSGNDFARGSGISRKPLIALKQILNAKKAQSLNVIEYEDSFSKQSGIFVNNIGIGVDAFIVHTSNKSPFKTILNKIKVGSLIYLSSAIKVLKKQSGFKVNIQMDDQEVQFNNAFLCTTTNHPFFGGGVAIAPDATVKSEQIDLIIVERISMTKILKLIFQILNRKHMSSPYIHHYTGNHLTIDTYNNQYAQADGEILGNRQYNLEFRTNRRNFWFE